MQPMQQAKAILVLQTDQLWIGRHPDAIGEEIYGKVHAVQTVLQLSTHLQAAGRVSEYHAMTAPFSLADRVVPCTRQHVQSTERRQCPLQRPKVVP